MKKTLLTVLQLAVTIGLLWWVFHDPVRRREMLEAVKLADWRWLAAGVGVFFLCTILILSHTPHILLPPACSRRSS